MKKSIKKILISGASLLMLASVGVGTSNLIEPVHAHSLLYKFWHTPTGKLYHGITLGGRYYPAGTKLYNTNYASGGYSAAMGPSPYAPRYMIPAWARKRSHTAHHHYYRSVRRHLTRKSRNHRSAHRHARHHARHDTRRHGRRSHHRY